MSTEAPKSRRRHAHSRAREIALQTLYQFEIGAKTLAELCEWKWLKNKAAVKVLEYAEHLAAGVAANTARDRELVQKYSHKDISQISTLVNVILRIGFWELQQAKLAQAIIIDDLLDLVRKYDGEDSVAFVNGILQAFYQENASQKKSI